MKIHAFKVDKTTESEQLENVFTQIKNQNYLRKRIRTINQTELRAEVVEERDSIWLVDFVKIRTDHGPGRVSRDSESKDLTLRKKKGLVRKLVLYMTQKQDIY